MAYEATLAARIDTATREWPGMTTKRMFGSIGWLLNGNICVGIWKTDLIVRCSPADWPDLLNRKHVAEFDITGRSMKGWLRVRPAAIATPGAFNEWLARAREFVSTLPDKSETKHRRAPSTSAAKRRRPH